MIQKNIAILFSGNGSNFEAIVKALNKKTFDNIQINIAVSICDNKNAYGIERAKKLNIDNIIVDYKRFNSRDDFEHSLKNALSKFCIDLIVLAGFMKILSKSFVSTFKIINIHPSILPLFKGVNALMQSYDSDMKIAGASVHYVNEEVDSGAMIEQDIIRKIDKESFESFKGRIHKLEHSLYPKAILKALKINT